MRNAIAAALLGVLSLLLATSLAWPGEETIVHGVVIDGDQIQSLAGVRVSAKLADVVDAPERDLTPSGLDGSFRVDALAALGHEHFDTPVMVYFNQDGYGKVQLLFHPDDRCRRVEVILLRSGAVPPLPPEEPWLTGHRSADGRTLFLRAFAAGIGRQSPESDGPIDGYQSELNGFLTSVGDFVTSTYVQPIAVQPLSGDFRWDSRSWRYYGMRLHAIAIATGEVEREAGYGRRMDVYSRFTVMPFIDGFQATEGEEWRLIESKAIGTIAMYRPFFPFWDFETLLALAVQEAKSALENCDPQKLRRARRYVVALERRLCNHGPSASAGHNCPYSPDSPGFRDIPGQIQRLLSQIDLALQ